MRSSWTLVSHRTSLRSRTVGSASRRRGRSTCDSTRAKTCQPRPISSISFARPSWRICSMNLARSDSAGALPAGWWKSGSRNRIRTSAGLAAIVRRAIPGHARHGPIDPATRVFQALRIAVNDELGQLERALAAIPGLLWPQGRAAIISFHSLEDRRVKWAFKKHPELNVLTRKPVTAAAREVARTRGPVVPN